MNKFAKKSLHLAYNIIRKYGYRISIKKLLYNKEIYSEDYPEDSIINRKFYNVSAGGHGNSCLIDHPYWTNLDIDGSIFSETGKKYEVEIVAYDMLQKDLLPIKDNSAEIILSKYSIEHVTNDAADFFFKESCRALKDNGVFRVVAPNVELDVRAYNNKDRSHFFWEEWMSKMPDVLGHRMPINQASLEQVFISHFAANASTLHVSDNPDKLKIINSEKLCKLRTLRMF